MYDTFGLFLSGAWVKGGETTEVFSPVTEKSLGKIAAATRDDTAAAIDAAESALGALTYSVSSASNAATSPCASFTRFFA